MKKVIKTLFLFFNFIMCPFITMAQSEVEQIEAIKHNIDFIYSDYVYKDENVARTRAKELLDYEIEHFIENSKDLSTSQGIVIKDIVTNAEEIHLQSGVLHRVFLFVKKKNICPADIITVVVDSDDTSNDNSQETALPLQEVPKTTSNVANYEFTQKWQEKFIDKILECKSYSELAVELSRGKAEYKIALLGNENNCTDIINCFWLVLNKDGSTLALLGPGEKRMNFQTKKEDSINNYREFKKFWFTLQK